MTTPNTEYDFVTIAGDRGQDYVRTFLNDCALGGWHVTSHADDGLEWSFVFMRKTQKEPLWRKLSRSVQNAARCVSAAVKRGLIQMRGYVHAAGKNTDTTITFIDTDWERRYLGTTDRAQDTTDTQTVRAVTQDPLWGIPAAIEETGGPYGGMTRDGRPNYIVTNR